MNYRLILFSILSSFFLLINSYGQNITIQNVSLTHEDTDQSAVRVKMEPKPDAVKEAFRDWMKDKYDIKLKGIGFLTNKDVLTGEKVNIPAISDKKMDFNVRVLRENELTHLSLFASFGYSIHITPSKFPREYKAMKNLLTQFMLDFLPTWYDKQIEISEDKIKALNSQRKDLAKEILKNEKDIEKLRKDNEEMSLELSQIQTDLNVFNNRLNNQKFNLESVQRSLKQIEKSTD